MREDMGLMARATQWEAHSGGDTVGDTVREAPTCWVFSSPDLRVYSSCNLSASSFGGLAVVAPANRPLGHPVVRRSSVGAAPRRSYSEPRATRTPRTFGMCPSFKGHFLSPRAKP